MKKCEKCGFTTGNSEMNFCVNCGAPFGDKKVDLSKKAAPIREVFPEKRAEEIYPAERNKMSDLENLGDLPNNTVPAATKNNKGGIIAACAMVAAFIIVAVLVFAIPQNKENKLSSEEISGTVISFENTEELTETMITMNEVFTNTTAATDMAANSELSAGSVSEMIPDISSENIDYSDSFMCNEISYFDMETGGRYILSDRSLTITKRMRILNETSQSGDDLTFYISCPFIEGSECDDKLNRSIENELYSHCFDITDGVGDLKYQRSDLNCMTAYIADITDDHIVFDVDTLFFQNNESNVWGENYKYLAFDLHDGHCIEISEIFENNDLSFLSGAKNTLKKCAAEYDLGDGTPFVTVPDLTDEYMCDPSGWLISSNKMRFIYPMYYGTGRSCMEFTADISLQVIYDKLSGYGEKLAASPKAEYHPNEAEDVFSTSSFDENCRIYKNKKYGYELVYPIDTYCTEFSDDGAVFTDGSRMTMELSCADNYKYKSITSYLEYIKETEPRITYSYYNDDYNYCGYTYYPDDTQVQIVYCIARLTPDHISTMKLTFQSDNGKSTEYYDSIIDSMLDFAKR